MMSGSNWFRALLFVSSLAFGAAPGLAQPSQPSSPPSPAPAKKPGPENPYTRLASAKAVIVKCVHGSCMPYDVISSTIDGWGRFTIADSPDKADLVIEISTVGGNSEIQVSASDTPSLLTGKPEHSSTTSKDISDAEITMTVLDAKSKRVLWTATEKAKNAMREKARENNLVEAAEKLASRFHDRLEPPPAKPQN